ncbi:MAG: phage holin family protein [Thermostichales cyanobacterium SZTDM-1c_bins_54]
MRELLITWILSALSVYVTAWIVPGIVVTDFGGALMAALAIGLVNGIVRPVLRVITLPVTILSLGIFWFILNALCLQLAGWIAGNGFTVQGFGSAVLGSLVLSCVSAIIHRLFRDP